MDVICPTCQSTIDAPNINISKDTAYCMSCQSLTALSSLLESSATTNFDKNNSVSGTRFADEGYRWKVEASHRSWMALFYVPFTLVWAGGSLSGIYGSQIAKGEFNPFLSLVGVPFLIGSIVLITLTLMSVFGRTLIAVENDKACVFLGVGSFGWYRRFAWSSIDRISEKVFSSNRGHGGYISLEGKKRLNLGWGLSNPKLYYVANVLRAMLKT